MRLKYVIMCEEGHDEIMEAVNELAEKFDRFVDQYNIDMHGDKDINGGKIGIVGHIREIRKYNRENPSLIWVAKNKPLVIIALIGLMSAIYIRESRDFIITNLLLLLGLF